MEIPKLTGNKDAEICLMRDLGPEYERESVNDYFRVLAPLQEKFYSMRSESLRRRATDIEKVKDIKKELEVYSLREYRVRAGMIYGLLKRVLGGLEGHERGLDDVARIACKGHWISTFEKKIWPHSYVNGSALGEFLLMQAIDPFLAMVISRSARDYIQKIDVSQFKEQNLNGQRKVERIFGELNLAGHEGVGRTYEILRKMKQNQDLRAGIRID